MKNEENDLKDRNSIRQREITLKDGRYMIPYTRSDELPDGPSQKSEKINSSLESENSDDN